MPPSHAPPTISPSAYSATQFSQLLRWKTPSPSFSCIAHIHSVSKFCWLYLQSIPRTWLHLTVTHVQAMLPPQLDFCIPWDCPCCLGSVANTVTWKSDQVTLLPKVLSISLRVKAVFSAASPRTLCNPIPSLLLWFYLLLTPSLSPLQTELIPLWPQQAGSGFRAFVPPCRSLCQEHSFSKTNVARLLGSFPKCHLFHEALPARSIYIAPPPRRHFQFSFSALLILTTYQLLVYFVFCLPY